MHKIELPGLPPFHPGAALATYGLYSVVPDARIYYKRGDDGGPYHPVLMTDRLRNLDDLVKHLVQPATWDGINLPPPLKVADTRQLMLFLKEFDRLARQDEAAAAGLGSDLKIAPPKEKKGKSKRNEVSVARSPFYFIDRTQWKFFDEVNKTRAFLFAKPEDAKTALSGFPWKGTEIGQNYGFFFDSVTGGDVAKNTLKDGKQSKIATTTIPVVCMLALAAWRLFPCYMQGKILTTAGWEQEKNGRYFVYPVFTKPHTRQEALSWLNNADLSGFARHRSAWAKLGIPAVYKTRRFRYPSRQGGGYLMSSVSL